MQYIALRYFQCKASPLFLPFNGGEMPLCNFAKFTQSISLYNSNLIKYFKFSCRILDTALQIKPNT